MGPNTPFDRNAPLFVIAYGHSGTTMLRQALGLAPEVFECKAETKFFNYLEDVRVVFRPISDRSVRRELVQYVASITERFAPPAIVAVDERRLDDDVADAIAADPVDHVGVFVNTLDHLTRCAGRVRWLEKTPTHIFELDEITSAIPNACFVEIVRLPLDALASKKTRQEIAAKNRGVEGMPQVDRFFHPVWDAISWRAAVRDGERLRAEHPDAAVRIRYEDLVDAPEPSLTTLCERIGVTFMPEMLRVRRSNAVGAGPKDYGISKLSVERWREVLTPGEVAIISAIVGRTARRVGYDLPRGRIDASAVRWLAKTVVDPVERVVAHARRTGWRSAFTAVARYSRRLAPSKK